MMYVSMASGHACSSTAAMVRKVRMTSRVSSPNGRWAGISGRLWSSSLPSTSNASADESSA